MMPFHGRRLRSVTPGCAAGFCRALIPPAAALVAPIAAELGELPALRQGN